MSTISKKRPILVKCDECGEEFYLTKLETEKKEGNERVYFTCPGCKKEFQMLIRALN